MAIVRVMTRIAICAPATRITRDHAESIETLVAEEFPQHSVSVHEQCFASHGHFAGTDMERLEALLECANDPAFDAVWFAKGGYGSGRIAEAAIAALASFSDSRNAPNRVRSRSVRVQVWTWRSGV